MAAPRVVVPPVVEPINVDETKRWIRQFDSSMDGVITLAIVGVRSLAEAYTNRAFMRQTLEFQLDAVPTGWIEIPRPPFVALVSVTYVDDEQNSTAMATSDFEVITGDYPAMRLKPDKDWPTASPRTVACIVVRYTAGVTSAGDVSEAVRFGIMTGVAYAIDNPGEGGLCETAQAVLDAVRLVPL